MSEAVTDEDASFEQATSGADETWMDCSLCDAGQSCEDELLPLPGRESHTADLEHFLSQVQLVRMAPRLPIEPPFDNDFWVFLKGLLEQGVSVGFPELPDSKATEPIPPGTSAALLNKYLQTGPINPIYPATISAMSGIPLDVVITELLYATHVGMMSMRWTPLCERCASPTCYKTNFDQNTPLPYNAWCKACRYSNPIDCLEKVKVVFLFHSDIFYVLAENLPCKPSDLSISLSEFIAMVPATYTGSGFRFAIGCDGDLMQRPPMKQGIYRMHCPISLTDGWFVVERDATEKDEPVEITVHVADYIYKGGKRKVLTVPHGKYRVHVFCDTQSFFIFWIQQNVDEHKLLYVPPAERPLATSVLLVMQNLTYKKLFEGTQDETARLARAVDQMSMDEVT